MERRIRIVGLCLIVAFALSAVVASAAQASVQLGQCVKVTKNGEGLYKGHFKDKNCTEAATEEEIALGAKGNKYNFEGGPGHLGKFTAKGKEVAFKSGQLEIKCKKSSGEGQVRNFDTISARFRFVSCVNVPRSTKCTSPKSNSGEIETKELVGALGENAKKETMITFEHKKSGIEGNPAEPWTEFDCAESKFTVSGSLGTKSTQVVNAISKKGGLESSEVFGEQKLEASFPNPLTNEPETEAIALSYGSGWKYEESYEIKQ